MKNTGIKIIGKEVLVSPASILDDITYERKGSSTHGYYVFANTSCSIDVKIGDNEMVWCYQNGTHYDYGDYNCPTNSFELVDDGVIGRIYNDSGEFNDDDLAEVIDALGELGLTDMTADDVVGLYEIMVNFRPSLSDLGISTEDEDFLYEVFDSEADEMVLHPYSDIENHWAIHRVLPKEDN